MRTILLTLLSLACAPGLFASFHLMQVEQVIGSLDGDPSAQAVQLRMRSAGQNLVSQARVRAWDAAGNNPVTILDMTTNVTNSAPGARILLATAAFTTKAQAVTPGFTPDFVITTPIPAGYLFAGRLTFENDAGGILWSVSWGGASYTGSQTGETTNDADGAFGPAFAQRLPTSGRRGLLFAGSATALSTTNAADYALSADPATVTRNSGTSVVLTPPVITVTTLNDDGPGSLRDAVRKAAERPGPEVIRFASSLNGKTITLGSQIRFDNAGDVTVDAGTLPAGLTIHGGRSVDGIFYNDEGNTTLHRLTLTGNSASGNGGGIYNDEGNMTLTQCTLSGNSASGSGGAIYNKRRGIMSLTQCTLSGNSASGSGGAIYNQYSIDGNSTITLTQCTLSGNSASGDGGGIYNEAGGIISLNRCIVAGNSSTAGADMYNATTDLTAGITLIGTNIVNVTSGSVFGPSPTPDALPLDLGPLASNGGPTQTHALLPGSPALNAGAGAAVTSDQRGLPIVGVADVGAFEVQTGGVFVFSASGYQVNENVGTSAVVTITRTGGFSGAASVRVSSTTGSATAADFTPITNQVVNFANGEISKTVTLAITNDSLAEANESFTVSLNTPSAGSSLGAVSTATVTIVDPSAPSSVTDTLAPGVPVISAPSPAAKVGVDVGGSMVISGTATDNKGVQSVSVVLNGTPGPTLTLAKPGATSTAFTGTLTGLLTGNNIVSVVTTDFAGRTTTSALRAFKVLRPLGVRISGFGTVTAGFAPKSYREAGQPQRLTAKPGAGFIFAGWTLLSGNTLLQLGITASDLEKPVLTLVHREGLSLQANFISNPFLATRTGTFNGSITPSTTQPATGGSGPGGVGTAPGLETDGYVTLVVTTKGSFTGSLKLGGSSLPVAGAFDHLGVARFGTSRSTTLSVPRPNKPSLNVSFNFDRITVTITGFTWLSESGLMSAVSDVVAQRAAFSTTSPVPATAFNATIARPAAGAYTQAMAHSSGGLLINQTPKGAGPGTVTVTPAGVVRVAGILSDNTAYTQTTTLSASGTWRLFAQLYPNKQGYISANVVIDHSQSSTDFNGVGTWVRPIQDTQHYPLGWPAGIPFGSKGSKYTVSAGSSVLPLVQAVGTGDGNATLDLTDGRLLNPIAKNVDISTADVVTEVPDDPSYSIKINRTTGMVTGSFLHTDGTVVSFTSVSFQKQNGAPGFFQTSTPKVKDYTGESGMVFLKVQP